MIGVSVPIGDRPHRIALQNPGGSVPDGAGGEVESWVNLDPPGLFVQILPATASNLERFTSGTVVSSATHLILGPFHPGITTKTQILFVDIHGQTHTFNVTGVSNTDMRDQNMTLTCEERVA